MGLFSSLFGPKVDLNEVINERKALILDVRTEGEFKSGHLRNSKNVPLDAIKLKARSLKNDKPIVVCCASGARSGMAKRILKKMNFEVYNGGSWSTLRKYTK